MRRDEDREPARGTGARTRRMRLRVSRVSLWSATVRSLAKLRMLGLPVAIDTGPPPCVRRRGPRAADAEVNSLCAWFTTCGNLCVVTRPWTMLRRAARAALRRAPRASGAMPPTGSSCRAPRPGQLRLLRTLERCDGAARGSGSSRGARRRAAVGDLEGRPRRGGRAGPAAARPDRPARDPAGAHPGRARPARGDLRAAARGRGGAAGAAVTRRAGGAAADAAGGRGAVAATIGRADGATRTASWGRAQDAGRRRARADPSFRRGAAGRAAEPVGGHRLVPGQGVDGAGRPCARDRPARGARDAHRDHDDLAPRARASAPR